jgi:AcrR family transcriptional regulator
VSSDLVFGPSISPSFRQVLEWTNIQKTIIVHSYHPVKAKGQLVAIDQANEFKSVDQSADPLAMYSDPMATRVLDAAEQCISRYGIRRTSMGEVARVGKLSRGSIYRHFKDKDSLVRGLFKRQQDVFLNRVEAQLENEETLVDKLTESVISGRKDMSEGLFASLAEVEPETAATMFMDPGFYMRSVSFWPPHIRLAQQRGEISSELDVDRATDLIMRLAVSLVLYPDMGVELKTRKALRAYLAQVVTLGLGSVAPSK